MADQMCRDVVNKKRESSGESGETVTVSFLGAGGQELSVQCPKDSYVLDAGLDAGMDLPYTCRGGICGACVGKVVSGTLDQSDIQDLSFTLSEDEQEQGMALLCMSRPETDCRIETQSDWGYSLGIAEWKGPSGEISGREVQPLTPWKEESK
ncbi:hypothetical protein WJX73_006003 [Symbiochloris irregularis]|uniref:Ferredoxin n=1 Tax=Symbiochloris irregularis TaxID=706552 RepID=A0AAW1P3V7_9CHLO